MMPNHQGKLDGLCGPYAIVNAFEHCCVKRPEQVFEVACSALAKSRWPNVLWEGTSFSDLKRMIKRCRDKVEGASVIQTRYPFEKHPPPNNKVYWTRFNKLFDDESNIRCAILGLWRPSEHWIVASRNTKGRLSFTDTNPYKPFQIKNCSSLHAGRRHGNPNKWVIERSDLILFLMP